MYEVGYIHRPTSTANQAFLHEHMQYTRHTYISRHIRKYTCMYAGYSCCSQYHIRMYEQFIQWVHTYIRMYIYPLHNPLISPVVLGVAVVGMRLSTQNVLQSTIRQVTAIGGAQGDQVEGGRIHPVTSSA